MDKECPCTAVMKLQRKTEKNLSDQEREIALMQAAMQQHIKDMGNSSLLIKECVEQLSDGAKIIRDIQENMRIYGSRLDKGDDDLTTIKTKVKNDSLAIKKDTKVIVGVLVFIAFVMQVAHPDIGIAKYILKLLL